MIELLVGISILIIGIFLIKQSEKDQPKKIFKVYAQPGRWYHLKFLVFLILLTLRRLKFYIFGKDVLLNVEKLDKLQMLSNHELAFDAVFFQAVSTDGIYICAGIERRQEAKAVVVVYLVLPEYGILESVHFPKTTLEADSSSLLSMERYAGGGLCITPVEPMKRWKISFNGKLRLHNNPQKVLDIELSAEWRSNYDFVFFEYDMPAKLIAKAMAREVWSRQFFENLKSAHQSHYEQMGYLDGTLSLDGKTIPLKNLDGFRDHSFGNKRDWSLMHRYIYHMIYLSNKVKISLGVVSQPLTSSHLEMGWVNHPDGRIDPVESIDLVLHEHGENGILPEVLHFSFKTVAADTTYNVTIRYEQEDMHLKGNDRDAKIYERFLMCEINGIPGRGISEWHYNNCGK